MRDNMNFEDIKQQMLKFLKDEVSKTNLKNVVVGISGGLDSAVVAILCKEVFKENMKGILMPSKFSSQSSLDDAKELCEKFNIDYEIIDITPMIDGYFANVDDATELRIGNFSARMRMSVLYDISARDNSLVIGTSNKSELLLGYGTIFGDIACAINPLGEIYKSDEFKLAKHIGVTSAILDKKPSADLWEGQSDEDELGYSYEVMDRVLKELVENNKSKADLLKENIDEALISLMEYRIKSNAFKGKLPTIASLKF
jgi:NAD+ synthase